jgi:hypothetical protein
MDRSNEHAPTWFNPEGCQPLFEFARAFIVIGDASQPARLFDIF